jgi:hypothetical protein
VTRRDDSTISAEDRRNVQRHAERLLRAADASGVFPTPVDTIIQAAGLRVAPESLDESLIQRLRRKGSELVKRALKKLLGLLHVRERLIFIDYGLYKKKILFIKLHETGHSWLPHQRDTYAVLEECEETLDPDIRDAFEREANVFASEVLFQVDRFTQDAADCAFGVRTPIQLSKRYGSSVYAAMRRYARTHADAVALLVFDPPDAVPGLGFEAVLRRTEQSESFTARFGNVKWPSKVSHDSQFGALIPVGRRMSSPLPVKMIDSNGDSNSGLGEGFFSGHQVFVLIRIDLRPSPLVVAQRIS